MWQFIVRRLLYSIVTLLILSATIFVIVRLTGDPVSLLAEAGARPEDLERIHRQWGLDRSWPVQYVSFLQNIVTGELGKSFNYRLPVSELYFQRLPNSLTLGLVATLISILIGVPAGIISAVKVNTWWDTIAKVVALLGLSIPGFWLGLVLILVFSVWLQWLPTSGAGDWRHVVMPALALGWYFAASMLRLTRSSMLEVLGSEYIKLARLKGLPDVVVIALHAFKNALIPVFTLAGVNMVVMINAAVIIEVIFAWPGIGRLLYEGIFQRDFPLVQGVVIIGGLILVALFADLIAPHDPTLPVKGANVFDPPFWMEGGSATTPLGTDFLGRDILSRLIYGARVSLIVGLMGTLVAGSIGTALGIASGYVAGWVDQIIMRVTDAWLALPAIVFAIFLAAMVGPSMWNIVVILGAVYWTRYARVIRGEVLTLRERDFVKLAEIAGASKLRVIKKHILPNVMNTATVLASLTVGVVIIAEASLSFLGVGVPPPQPAWGLMLSEARPTLMTGQWWLTVFPGVCILLIVLATQLFGDWLRVRLDPQTRNL